MNQIGGYTSVGSKYGTAVQSTQTPTIDTPLESSSPSCFSETETERGTPTSTPSPSPAPYRPRATLGSSSPSCFSKTETERGTPTSTPSLIPASYRPRVSLSPFFDSDAIRSTSTPHPYRGSFQPQAPSFTRSVSETERGTPTFTPSPSRSPLGPRDPNSPSSPPAIIQRTRDNREGVPFIGTPAVGRGGDWSKVAYAKIALREAVAEPLQPEVCLCIYTKGRDGLMEITIAHRDFWKLSEEIETESNFKRVEPTVGQEQRELSNQERTARKQLGRGIAEKLLDDWATYGTDGFGEICIIVGGEECHSFVMKKGAEFSVLS